MVRHPIFNFEVPTAAPGIDAKYLAAPEGEVVSQLAQRFIGNFEQLGADPELAKEGGPIASST